MIDVEGIKATIILRKLTQKDVYTLMGMTKRQWVSRMNARKMNSEEMQKLHKILRFDNPMSIFFGDEGTQDAPQ